MRFTCGEIAALSWHNGGCNSAENAVRTWMFVPRMTVCEPRHCAPPLPRCPYGQIPVIRVHFSTDVVVLRTIFLNAFLKYYISHF